MVLAAAVQCLQSTVTIEQTSQCIQQWAHTHTQCQTERKSNAWVPYPMLRESLNTSSSSSCSSLLSPSLSLSLACSLAAKLFPRKFNASGSRHMQTQNVSTITYLFIFRLWDTRNRRADSRLTHTQQLLSVLFGSDWSWSWYWAVVCCIQIVYNKQN